MDFWASAREGALGRGVEDFDRAPGVHKGMLEETEQEFGQEHPPYSGVNRLLADLAFANSLVERQAGGTWFAVTGASKMRPTTRAMRPSRKTAVVVSTGCAAHVRAILNNLVLGLIRLMKFDFVPQARRFFNARFDVALHLLLSPP